MSPSTHVAAMSLVVAVNPPPTQRFQVIPKVVRLLAVFEEQQLISRKVTSILLPIRDIVIEVELQQSPGKAKREADE